MKKITKIAQTVIDELDSFNKNFSLSNNKEPEIDIYFNNLTGSLKKKPQANPQHELQKRIATLNLEYQKLAKEPFICYAKVLVEIDGVKPFEQVYLFCRGYTPPSTVRPFSKNGVFVNRNAKLGDIASMKIGSSKEITFVIDNKKIVKSFTLLEKSIFNPLKNEIWDAKNNNIWIEEEENPKFLVSTIEFLSDFISNKNKGTALLTEIEELEKVTLEDTEKIQQEKRQSQRVIVDSISLKDSPILDEFQNDFSRLPLKSTNLLIGSPGTGKTTALIKRIHLKSDLFHLAETDEIVLESDEVRNWVMFTPNDLLKIYLKEAMNKENLSATDKQVLTWDKERSEIGRDVLKFLKTIDSGKFSRTNRNDILLDNSSKNLSDFTNEFINYYNLNFQNSLANSIEILEKNNPEAKILTKETFRIAEDFRTFTNEIKLLFEQIKNRKISDEIYRNLSLIERFQRIKPQLLILKNQIRNFIDKTLNDLIVSNPEIIEKISNLISQDVNNQNEEIESEENPITEENFIELDDDEINEVEAEDVDLKIKAKKMLRNVIIRYAENLSLKNKIKNKKYLQIFEMIEPNIKEINDFYFLGRVNISLRQRIFNLLDYSKLLEYVPNYYDKFRLDLISSETKYFSKDKLDSIKKRRISQNEIDVLIYAMLQLASKIFEEKRDFLNQETNYDLLENIKTRYKTQITVDEASDFSAIQLGCMYLLAHPKYKSISFAGDLMQRVTDVGISNWDECEFFSKQVSKKELEISYRQTPILLEIARKLYKNSIGQEPPFRSNYSSEFNNPKPLKFNTDINEKLGKWIANRVAEIYKINNERLPSIAVFVPEENDIDFAYEAIQEQLNEISIDVEKCKEGKFGEGSKVRIFSVEYIKGLEFEGVFFINVDEMQEKSDDLLDKYLYVGLTRATTFLGITHKSKFPEKIKFIENSFSDGNWSEFI